MSKVKLTEVQKEKIAEFLSEQLATLKTEKRLGRVHYGLNEGNNTSSVSETENLLKTLDEAIRIGIAEEIWNR